MFHRISGSSQKLTCTQIYNGQGIAVAFGADAGHNLGSQIWHEEIRALAVSSVDTPTLSPKLALVSRGVVAKPEVIDLSEGYLKNAGLVLKVLCQVRERRQDSVNGFNELQENYLSQFTSPTMQPARNFKNFYLHIRIHESARTILPFLRRGH